MKLVQKESRIHGSSKLNFAIYRHPDHTVLPPWPSHYTPPHWHPEYEFNYANNAPVTYTINGINYTIRPGELLFINKNSIHSSDTFPKYYNHYFSIVFGEQFIFPNLMDSLYQTYMLPLQQQHKCFPTIITQETDFGTKIISHVKELLQCYFNKEQAYELNLRSHLLAIFSIAIGQNILIDSDFKENSTAFIVRNALSIIHENYMKPITIWELASDLGVTPEYFCRIFKAAIGRRPLEYINSCRIDNSLFYLSQTQDSITSIASKCGFDDINYFSRCFKKIQGITPTEYRKIIFKNTQTSLSNKENRVR